jgi:flagellar protein FlbD
MIQLTRLNHVPFYLNPDLIEQIERTPDTVIRLTTGVRVVVVEEAEMVVERVIAYRQRVVRGAISNEAETQQVPCPGPGGSGTGEV